MKKRINVILAIVMAALLLTGCAASNSAAMDGFDGAGSSASGGKFENNFVTEDSTTADGEMVMDDAADGFVGAASTEQQVSFTEKIIYSANANIETVKFDESVEKVYEMVEQYGGFLERSYVSGVNYDAEFYGYQTYRDAEFVIRIPADSFKGFKSALGNIGNVTNITSDAQNVTTQYYDIESRLTAYKTQEETLLNMLAKAETVSDMIEIESALSEVRYNIEALTTTLKNLDNQVNYSTVTIWIAEVRELTRQVAVQRTYWEEISDGFVSSLESIGRFFKELFRWFVSSLPVLILLAAALIVVLIIVRKKFARQIAEKRELRALRKGAKRGKKNDTSAEEDKNSADNS